MDIKKFIFNKMTLFAILLAMLYQIFMLGIYLGGYRYTSNHTSDATIVYVNNDGENGAKIIDEIASNMDFKSKKVSSVAKAKEYLRDHEAVLVMEVPKNYTEDLTNGKTVQLNYYINSTGDSTSKTLGNSVSTKVTDKLNKAVTSKKMQATLVKLMLVANQDKIKEDIQNAAATDPSLMADQAQLNALQEQVTEQYTKQFATQAKELATATNVKNNTVDINTKSSDMNHVMAPMISAMAGFIAAMTSSTILFSSFDLEAKKKAKNKWKAFFSIQTIYLLIACGAAVAAAIMLMIINDISGTTALQVFGATFLNIFVSFQVLSVVNLLFGPLGIVINIPLIFIQSITSGSVMSAPLMPSAYRFIRDLLPMPSAYQLNLNILFGTNSTSDPLTHLILIGICALAIELVILLVKYRKDQEFPKAVGPMNMTGF